MHVLIRLFTTSKISFINTNSFVDSCDVNEVSLSTVENEKVEFLYFMNETTNVAMNEDIREIQRNSTLITGKTFNDFCADKTNE